MFKHIMIATDGSELSGKAVRGGLRVARQMNAKVSGVHVTRPFHVVATGTEALTDTRQEYEKHARGAAKRILRQFEGEAVKQGVKADGVYLSSDRPYEAIIQAAKEKGCDVIFMASHGRSGVKGFLLGSETQKVLAHSKIPVLVYR